MEIDLQKFIENVRSCCQATLNTAHNERKADEKFELRCYRDLFRQVFGRKPTAEELDRMTGR